MTPLSLAHEHLCWTQDAEALACVEVEACLRRTDATAADWAHLLTVYRADIEACRGWRSWCAELLRKVPAANDDRSVA